jgi:AhpD family alkylhydroperoxidase
MGRSVSRVRTGQRAQPGSPSSQEHDGGAQRVRGVPEASAPFWLRILYALQRRRHGVVFEPTRVWARAPAPMLGFMHFAAAVDRRGSPIEPPLRSLVTVKVSQLNRCSFCVDLNVAKLQKSGIAIEKAAALARHETSPLFSPKERAALDYAAAMTKTGAGVDEETFVRLRGFFDDDAIVELTALVALQNASSKFNAALAIPAQGFCPTMPALAAIATDDKRAGETRKDCIRGGIDAQPFRGSTS